MGPCVRGSCSRRACRVVSGILVCGDCSIFEDWSNSFFCFLTESLRIALCFRIMQPEASERMSLVSIEEILVFALGFVVKSFSFEVLFDFFHYVVHRCYHENR